MAFGTLFNQITIKRFDNNGNEIQEIPVPISFGPAQRWLARTTSNPDLDENVAVSMPRISFEITGIEYDAERKLGSLQGCSRPNSSSPNDFDSQFLKTPYNLNISLVVMTKYTEDGYKILEQILPFFQPEFTPSIRLVDELDLYFDIPMILNSVNVEDTYEADLKTRRAIIWTLDFTIKGFYFGPTTQKKIIKFSNTDIYASFDDADPSTNIKVQPGLTANGEPTTELSESIPYANISFDDDWDYITTITTLEDEQ